MAVGRYVVARDTGIEAKRVYDWVRKGSGDVDALNDNVAMVNFVRRWKDLASEVRPQYPVQYPVPPTRINLYPPRGSICNCWGYCTIAPWCSMVLPDTLNLRRAPSLWIGGSVAQVDDPRTDDPRTAPASLDNAAIASDPEVKDDGAVEEKTSSSEEESRSAGRRKSHRSHRRKSSGGDSNDMREVESTIAEPMTAEPAPPSPPKNPKTKDLDALLSGQSAGKPSHQSNNRPAGAEQSSVKESLSRSEVQQGIAQVAPAVKRCGQGKGGTIMLSIVIGKNGRISNAVATGIYAGTPIAACATRAVRQARFPAIRQNVNVKYPFQL